MTRYHLRKIMEYANINYDIRLFSLEINAMLQSIRCTPIIDTEVVPSNTINFVNALNCLTYRQDKIKKYILLNN